MTHVPPLKEPAVIWDTQINAQLRKFINAMKETETSCTVETRTKGMASSTEGVLRRALGCVSTDFPAKESESSNIEEKDQEDWTTRSST